MERIPHRYFDTRALSPRDCYKLLIGTVIPRPIALVTTVDEQGRFNAAPYSFFNCLSADPPLLALGVENRADRALKDTAANIRATEEFTVHIVSLAMAEAMNVCAVPFDPGVDELARAGFTALPGLAVRSPRIAEAPVAFECRRYVGLAIGRSREIILGLVVGIHVPEDGVNASHHVAPSSIDAIGRMGGHGYCSTRETFDMPTMSVAQWEARNGRR